MRLTAGDLGGVACPLVSVTLGILGGALEYL